MHRNWPASVLQWSRGDAGEGALQPWCRRNEAAALWLAGAVQLLAVIADHGVQVEEDAPTYWGCME